MAIIRREANVFSLAVTLDATIQHMPTHPPFFLTLNENELPASSRRARLICHIFSKAYCDA